MSRLQKMSNAELVAEARRRAKEARENDEKLGHMLETLLETVGEMTRRLETE